MLLQREILQKAGVPQEDIQRLEKAWDAYQTAASDPVRQIPHIVCTGIYNAGKSTLLNALCGEERFPTGDVPTTKTVAQSEFNGAVYIDTPGLNAQKGDDLEAQKAYESADFILLVANIQNGGIGEAEAVWLKGLRERYTADSLRQRLIYVLTHCGQIEPEEATTIRDKICADLERIIGFAPDPIFCVDSVIYQKGVSEDKPLLAEHSGIPHLQSYLTKLIPGALQILRQARKAGLDARRKELVNQIDQCQVFLEQELYQKSQKSKDKIAILDAVWAELISSLPEKSHVNVCSRYIFSLPYPSNRSGQAKSESEARQKLESALRTTYDSRDRILDKVVDSFMQEAHRYTADGLDSRYFSECSSVNQAFEKCVLDLQKIGVSVQKDTDISVKPDIPYGLASELERSLRDGVVRYGDYYSLSKYIDMYADIYSIGTSYEKGFLGIIREIPCYSYDIGSAKREMEKDMESEWKSNVSSVNQRLTGIWQDFLIKLYAAVNTRKTALKSQVDAYRSTLQQESDHTGIDAAISHLDTLKKEMLNE